MTAVDEGIGDARALAPSLFRALCDWRRI